MSIELQILIALVGGIIAGTVSTYLSLLLTGRIRSDMK